MVNIAKFGDSAIKFTFTGNDHYLYNGEITVPLNSLILVVDETDMVNFKKTDGDMFVSFLISNSNFGSKQALIEFYKESMVGGGIDADDVQEMIDESISGKADTSAVTESINEATSGFADSVQFNSTTKYVEFYNGSTKVFEYDASAFVIDGMVQNVEIKDVTISGESVTCLVISFNTEAGKQDINIPISEIFDANNYYTKTEVDNALSGKLDTSIFITYSGDVDSRLSEDEEVTSAALNDLNEGLSGKADLSGVTESINAAVSGKVDTTTYNTYTAATDTALASKQTTLTAGTGIDITDNVISATGGGGANYSAGTGIEITNNVISVSGVVETSAITTTLSSGSTDTQIPSAKAIYDIIAEDEQVTSAALNYLNDTIGNINSILNGI